MTHAGMPTQPQVSVLVPTRNRAGLLRTALASVQRQTLRDIEILVLDDGSYDQTPCVLDAASKADPRLRVFRNSKSGGLPAALNHLLATARSPLVAVMHDDDVAYPARLETQAMFIDTRGLDICGTWYRRFGHVPGGIAQPPVDDGAIKAALHFQPPLLHPSVLMRRDWALRIGGYSDEFQRAAEDYDLWTRLAAAGARFGNVPQVLMRYRLSAVQASRVFNSEQAALAHRIRARYLADCGIPASQEQVDLHVRVRDPAPIESLDELRAFEAWLVWLREHFAGNPAAAQVVAQQWLFIGCRGAGLGMRCWRMWRASPLAAAISPRKAVVLLALCAGRVRYRSAPYRLLEPFAPA